MKTNRIIRIHDKEIQILQIGTTQYVPIRPICEAIGVSSKGQIPKIKDDEVLADLLETHDVEAADGKTREMQTLPLQYVFGWLFQIHAGKVKPELKQSIIKYKLECYNILFDEYNRRSSVLKEKSEYLKRISELDEQLKSDARYKEMQDLKKLTKNATQRLNALDKKEVEQQTKLL